MNITRSRWCWVVVGCGVLLTACSGSHTADDDPLATDEQGTRTFAASSRTRTELGIHHWELSRQDEGPTIRVAETTGYSAEGKPLRSITLRRTAGANEGWSEFSVLGPTPARVRFTRDAAGTTRQEGPSDAFERDGAGETVDCLFRDLQDAESSSRIPTKSLRMQTNLVTGAPSQIVADAPETLMFQCFQECLASIPDLYGQGAAAYCRELAGMGVC